MLLFIIDACDVDYYTSSTLLLMNKISVTGCLTWAVGKGGRGEGGYVQEK